MFQCTQWILETWGSGRRAVLYIELPNNKIEFHVTIYRLLFTFFKINFLKSFSSNSPFHILKASYLWKVERRVATNKNWKKDFHFSHFKKKKDSHFKRNFVPVFLISEKWCQYSVIRNHLNQNSTQCLTCHNYIESTQLFHTRGEKLSPMK